MLGKQSEKLYHDVYKIDNQLFIEISELMNPEFGMAQSPLGFSLYPPVSSERVGYI